MISLFRAGGCCSRPLSSARVSLQQSLGLSVLTAPAVTKTLPSNLHQQAQHWVVSLDSTLGQKSPHLVNSVPRATRTSQIMIFRVRVETLSLQGPGTGHNVRRWAHNLQRWATTVGRTLPAPAVIPWDVLVALGTLFTRCGDFCPKVESRETTQCWACW